MNLSSKLPSCLFRSNNKATTVFLRSWHARPMIQYDVTQPEVDWSNYPGHQDFSPHVQTHIEARNLENSGGSRRVDVLNLQTGKKAGTILLNDFVFGENPRIDVLHQNSVWYRACIRKGTAHTKDRGEMRGGGRKPWPQKGMGKARHGSIRSPLFHKGGVAHGPKARLDLPKSVPGPKPYAYNLPYKVRRLGVRTALSCRLAQNDLTVVENLTTDLPGDRQEFQDLFVKRELPDSVLIVDGCGDENEHLKYLVQDMPRVEQTDIMRLLVHSILIKQHLILSLDAVRMLEERLCEDNRIINHPNYQLLHENWLLPKDFLYKEYCPFYKMIRGRLQPMPPKRPIKHLMSLTRRDTPYGQM